MQAPCQQRGLHRQGTIRSVGTPLPSRRPRVTARWAAAGASTQPKISRWGLAQAREDRSRSSTCTIPCAVSTPAAAGVEGAEMPVRPLSVCIAGGGIGGLVLAVALLKKGVQVKVYERDMTAIRGEGKYRGPIQVQSNALAALEAVDAAMAEEVMAAGCVTGDRVNGLCDGVTGDWYCKFDTFHPAVDRGLPVTRVISRVELQQISARHAARLGGDAIIEPSATVERFEEVVDPATGEGRVRVSLADGRSEEFDLLVGADGIWSRIRTALVGETKANYSGYTCYTGISDFTPPDIEIVGYRVYLGNGQYFVSSDVGGGKMQWYGFHKEPPGGDDGDGKRKARLLELFGHWTDDVVDLIKATPEEDVLRRDIYDRPPIFKWHKGRVVLLGDSAHAMQPNLGQGGCMAIEDALTLAEELTAAHAKAGGRPGAIDVDGTLHRYQDQRMMRAAAIHGMAGMAAMMAATYKAYLGEGLGPLSWIQRWKLPHPGRVSGQVVLRTTMPAVLAWVLGGNIGALADAARPGACRVSDGLKHFTEADFERFMADNDALLRAAHARWMLLAERPPSTASGADATSCSDAKGVYLPLEGGDDDGAVVVCGAVAARQQQQQQQAQGQQQQQTLVVDDVAVTSARHARAWRDAATGDYYLQHLAGGASGTWVNGRRLGDGERVRLVPGDRVEFGRSPSHEVFKVKMQHESLFCSALRGDAYAVIPAAGAAVQELSAGVDAARAAAAAAAGAEVAARR